MKKSGWASEFKTFIMRGNVLDMAVGVVIGSAFTAIVTSVVENLLTPIIALIMGKNGFFWNYRWTLWNWCGDQRHRHLPDHGICGILDR